MRNHACVLVLPLFTSTDPSLRISSTKSFLLSSAASMRAVSPSELRPLFASMSACPSSSLTTSRCAEKPTSVALGHEHLEYELQQNVSACKITFIYYQFQPVQRGSSVSSPLVHVRHVVADEQPNVVGMASVGGVIERRRRIAPLDGRYVGVNFRMPQQRPHDIEVTLAVTVTLEGRHDERGHPIRRPGGFRAGFSSDLDKQLNESSLRRCN